MLNSFPLRWAIPHALISPFVALFFARLLVGASPRRRRATPPRSAPCGAPVPALCPRLSSQCHPECARVLPQSLRPLSWLCPCLQRDLAVETSGAAAIRTGRPNRVGRWISDVHSRSGGLGLIRADLILVVCCRSSRSDFPLTCAPAAGPGLSAYLRSLTPQAHLSALIARRRVHVLAPGLFSAVDLRFDHREIPIPLHVVKLLKRPPVFWNQPIVPGFHMQAPCNLADWTLDF
jgi:hypothetical protein